MVQQSLPANFSAAGVLVGRPIFFPDTGNKIRQASVPEPSRVTTDISKPGFRAIEFE
jgi:hypothetical protein